jgi:hypothetical protein
MSSKMGSWYSKNSFIPFSNDLLANVAPFFYEAEQALKRIFEPGKNRPAVSLALPFGKETVISHAWPFFWLFGKLFLVYFQIVLTVQGLNDSPELLHV